MGGLRLCFLLVATICVTKAVGEYDVEGVLGKVPEDERIPFLKHHILKGYDLVNVDNKGNMEINKEHNYDDLPEEFSMALYHMAKENHSILNDYLLSLLGTIICFPSGECIDIGDVGVHPRHQHE